MPDIIYDIDELKRAKNAIEKLKTELDKKNKALDNALTDLKNEWITDAGKKFFDTHKDNWSKYVKKYVKKLDGVKQMLDAAITEYTKINNEVKNLKV